MLVVGLFDDQARADAACADLLRSGFAPQALTRLAETVGPSAPNGLGEEPAAFERDFGRELAALGVPNRDAEVYAEGIRRQGVVLAVRVPKDRAERALAILNRYGPADLDARARPRRNPTAP